MPTKKAAKKAEAAKVEAPVKPKESKPAPPDAIPTAAEYDQFRHANHSHLNP